MEKVLCKICLSRKLRKLYDLTSDTFNDKPRIYTIAECCNCRTIFVKNPPTEKELCRMYSNEYFNKTEHDFDQEKFCNTIDSSTVQRYNRTLDLIEKYVKKGKILDIGSGLGSFLTIARKRGWEVYGMEPSKDMAHYSKDKLKIDIQNTTIDKARYKKEFYDAAIMDNVLEHVSDPLAALKMIAIWIKKKGVLVIEVPNERGMLFSAVRLYKRVRNLLGITNREKLLQHLFYFDVKSLSFLLNKAGFRIVEW
jgi:2-polyprenyl-3-methyl-5-hydroxy-6-metoxy-1,4-benzoquinol methylase